MSTKTFTAKAKALSDEEGIVEALVATYDLDSGGDQIVPGAFEKSLTEWAESGDPIPFIWSHQHNDLNAYLGQVIEAKETDQGLYVKAQIDMDDEQNRKAYRQIKGGRVKNYSFAYDIRDAEDKDGVQMLKDLELIEVGPTLIGMNRATRTLAVKNVLHGTIEAVDLEVKAGRTLSAKNEQKIHDAISALQDVLSSLGEANDDGKASESSPAKDEEPEAAKSEEPSRDSSARYRSAQMQLLALRGEGGSQ